MVIVGGPPSRTVSSVRPDTGTNTAPSPGGLGAVGPAELGNGGTPPAPHPALGRAIDAADWTAFARELAVWEQRACGVGAADGAA